MVKATRVPPRLVPFFRSFNPRTAVLFPTARHAGYAVYARHVGINQLERVEQALFLRVSQHAHTDRLSSRFPSRPWPVRDRVRHDRGENRSIRSIDRVQQQRGCSLIQLDDHDRNEAKGN